MKTARELDQWEAEFPSWDVGRHTTWTPFENTRGCTTSAMFTTKMGRFARSRHEICPDCEIGPPLKVLSLFRPWRRREMIGYTAGTAEFTANGPARSEEGTRGAGVISGLPTTRREPYSPLLVTRFPEINGLPTCGNLPSQRWSHRAFNQVFLAQFRWIFS